MSTKRLAKELGIIRKRTPSSSSHTHTSSTDQLFSYLIIIDFESTCWREKNNHGQEIIEFPAVLMNTHTGQIESEFHSYVQPQEHPVLSSFCTELTGITQEQVEAGLPLQICLSRFTRWLHTLQQERDVVFQRDDTHTTKSGKPCAFVTWSDWDLGVCLQYECKRKQISKPEVLNSWIDLRATYRIFYQRKPKGLNGALQDLGIEFSGREHSGLDDARNTARLAWRMIRDGCVMKITKSQSRALLKSRAPMCNERKGKQPTHTGTTHTRTHTRSHTETSTHTSVCQNLVSLRTVLPSITTPLNTLTVTHTSHTDTPVTHTDTPVTHTDTPVSHTDMPVSHTDTPVSHTDTPVSHTSHTDTSAFDWPEEFVPTEFGESGSYDDVILEDISENMPHNSASTLYKTKPHPPNSNPPCSTKEPIRSLKSLGTGTTPTIPFSIYNDQTHQSSSSSSSSSSSTAVFRIPCSIVSKVNQPASSFCSVNQSACSSLPVNQSTLSSVSLNQSALSYIPVNKSAHYSCSINQTRPSCSVNQSLSSSSSKQLPLPPLRGRTGSRSTKSALSSISLNQSTPFSVSVNQSRQSTLLINQSAVTTSSSKHLPRPPPRGGVKITAPLCGCGRRSRRLTVCNGGPNQGRAFYTCSGRRSSGPAPRNPTRPCTTSRNNGCGFFKWESALFKSSAVGRNTSVLNFSLSTAASRNFR